MTEANLTDANLSHANLENAALKWANNLGVTTGSPHYYPNTTLLSSFDPVAKGWALAPYCNFTGDTPCDVLDINRMFEVGNRVTGVVTSVSTERFELVDDDIIDAADITEWLPLAATEIGYDTPFSRGDINLDHDVDTRDLTAMIIGFTSAGVTIGGNPDLERFQRHPAGKYRIMDSHKLGWYEQDFQRFNSDL